MPGIQPVTMNIPTNGSSSWNENENITVFENASTIPSSGSLPGSAPMKMDVPCGPLDVWWANYATGEVRHLTKEAIAGLMNGSVTVPMAPTGDSGSSPDLILLLYYPMPWNTSTPITLLCNGEVYRVDSGSGSGQVDSTAAAQAVKVEYFNASSGKFHSPSWGTVNENLTLTLSTAICGNAVAEAGGLRLFTVRIIVDYPYGLKLHKALLIYRDVDVNLLRSVIGYALVVPMNRLSTSLTPVQISDAWLAALIISSIIFLISSAPTSETSKRRRKTSQFQFPNIRYDWL